MKKKVKEMDTRRKEMERGRRGISGYGGNMGSFGRQFDSSSGVVPVLADTIPAEQPKYSLNNSSSRITTNTTGINKAMKLGSKRGNVDSFVDQLKNEGEGSNVHISDSLIKVILINSYFLIMLYFRHSCSCYH